MRNKKIAVFLPYANPHVMGWLIELRKFNQVIIGIKTSVKEFREGYFDHQDNLENVLYFFKKDQEALFYKELNRVDVLITLGIFDPLLFKLRLYAPRLSSIYILSEPYNPITGRQPLFIRRLFICLFKIFYSQVNILCIGGAEIKEYYWNLGFKKAKYFNFGYFPELCSLPDLLKTKKRNYHTTNFLYVGQLIERKGINCLMKAINDLSNYTETTDWRFDIIGNGILDQEVIKVASLYKNVHYHGLISDSNLLNEFYQQADVLVVPSLFDGWAAVVNEGIANACAIIARDTVYSTKSLVENKKNGFIFVDDDQLLPSLLMYLNGDIDIFSHQTYSLKIFEEWNHVNAARSISRLIDIYPNDNDLLLKEL
jgi:glycosyltransferase involved in cell wall biosynthesis